MTPVQFYIDELPASQRQICQILHDIFTQELELEPKIRYKIPFYFHNSWICYLNPIKKDSVELAFTRGNELSNENGLLQANGRKQIMGIILTNVDEIPLDAILDTMQEALLLDETVKYKSKRQK